MKASKAPAKKAKKTRDLAAKSPSSVKGGGRKLFNDNITLLRMAKPKSKDLAPKSPAKVKGGGPRLNDNITLVRTK